MLFTEATVVVPLHRHPLSQALVQRQSTVDWARISFRVVAGRMFCMRATAVRSRREQQLLQAAGLPICMAGLDLPFLKIYFPATI
jgi:hypothetical protein